MNAAQIFCSLMTVFLATSVPSIMKAQSSSGTIKLPQPVLNSKTSLESALRARRSNRAYKSQPITLSDLSQLLWAAQGITGQGRRTAPSAGALYPLEVSVVAGNVSGLDAGVFVYKPEGHELLKVADGDKRAELSRAALRQPAIQHAPAVLVISAVYERTTIKYGERGIRYVHMEAGHAAENVYLQAVSLNLGTVVIGAFDDEGVKTAVNLTIREQPLYIMPIGGL
jgi:SagB-type dehydrogenase family enzyme